MDVADRWRSHLECECLKGAPGESHCLMRGEKFGSRARPPPLQPGTKLSKNHDDASFDDLDRKDRAWTENSRELRLVQEVCVSGCRRCSARSMLQTSRRTRHGYCLGDAISAAIDIRLVLKSLLSLEGKPHENLREDDATASNERLSVFREGAENSTRGACAPLSTESFRLSDLGYASPLANDFNRQPTQPTQLRGVSIRVHSWLTQL